MPIPMSNQQKHIQPPQVQTGRALNLAQEADTSIKMAASLAAPIAQAPKSIATIAQTIRNGDDLEKANNAWLKYTQQLGDLNADYANKRNQEFLDGVEKYDHTANGFHQELLKTLDTIQNPEIREAFRSKANGINLQNRQNFAVQTDRARREQQATASDAAINNMIQIAVNNSTDFTGETAYNYPLTTVDNFERLAKQIYGDVASFMATQGVLDSVAVSNAARQYNERLAKQIIDKVNAENPSNEPWQESLPGKQFLSLLERSDLVSQSFAMGEFKRMESEDVILEVMKRPEQFIGRDGKFIEEDRLKDAPHLSHYEYDRIVKNAESMAAQLKSAEIGILANSMADAYSNDKLNWNYNHGFIDKDMKQAILDMGVPEEEFDEKLAPEFDKKRAGTSPMEIGKRAKSIITQMNTPVLWDKDTGKVFTDKDGMSEAEMRQQMRINPERYEIVRPLMENKEMRSDLRAMELLGKMSYASFDPKKDYGAKQYGDIKIRPVDEVVYDRVMRSFKAAEKINGETPLSAVYDITMRALDELSAGIILPAETEVNGKQLTRSYQLDATQGIRDDSPIHLQMIDEAIRLAAARTLPPESYRAIVEGVSQYQAQLGGMWSYNNDMAKLPGLGTDTFNPLAREYYNIFTKKPTKAKGVAALDPAYLTGQVASDALASILKMLNPDDAQGVTYNQAQVLRTLLDKEGNVWERRYLTNEETTKNGTKK